MLKSTLNAAKPSEPKRPTLPHLFRGVTGMIALFDTESSATIISFRNAHHQYGNGTHVEDVGSCWNQDEWTPLKPGESVTITVEED